MSLTEPYRRIMSEMQATTDEIRRYASKKTVTEAEEARLEELRAQFDKLDADRMDLAREALVRRIDPMTGTALQGERGHTPDDDPFGEPRSVETPKHQNPWDLVGDSYAYRTASPAEWRSRALSAVEQAHGADDEAREAMTRVLEEHDDKQARLSRLAVLTSDPAYLRAFGELLRTGGLNPMLSQDEIMAIRRVSAEARSMTLTSTSGGYLVPFQLDPSVIITSDGSMNPIRRVARNVVATGNKWHGVSAGATQWSWDAELEQVSDDASTFAQPAVDIHTARGFIPISIEAFEDGANVTEEVRRLLSFGRNTLEETAFVTGTGSGEPYGIVSALNGVAGSVVSATTNNAFVAADVYKLDEALPARFRQSARAAWFANRAIWNDIDLFETSNGSKQFEGVVGNPGTLLGSPTYEAEAMDGAIATGDDYVLVYGDFDHYVIASRSSSVEFIPHLFGTSDNRPIGARGIWAHYRTGADSVHDGAFRLLKV